VPRLDRRLRIALDAGTTSIGISTPAHGELTGDDGALEGKITQVIQAWVAGQKPAAMQARATGRTRRAGRRCAGLVRSRCGKQAAMRRCLASSHDSCWTALVVEHQSRSDSCPSQRWCGSALDNREETTSTSGRLGQWLASRVR
jgi:hypothetical protein